MANSIIPFASAQVPAHLEDLFGESNIQPKASINQLSYRGKTWRRVVDGKEAPLTRKNESGDDEPVSIVSLVVLDHNKQRSRAYYPGNFEEGKNVAPACYSGDGKVPDAGVKEPCGSTCADCKYAVKGSKISENNKPTTACTPFKRIAVVPSSGIGKHPALLLRLAQTSIWDGNNGENEAKGWYAWDQYVDMLRARGARHTALVETQVKFDLRVAFPKLLFSAKRWLDQDEAVAAKSVLDDSAEDIALILTGAGANDGVAGSPATPAAVAPQAAPEEFDDIPDFPAANAAAAEKAAAEKAAAEKAAAEKAAAEKAAAEKAAAETKTSEAAKIKAIKVAKAKAAAEAAAKVAAEAAKAAAEAAKAAKEDDIEDVQVKGEEPPVVQATPATGMGNGLADLLSSWDD